MIKKWFGVGVLLAVFSVLSISSSLQKSATWDETIYLGIGLYLFENSQWNIPSVSLHPPLSYYLSSMPLLFCSLNRSCFKEGRTRIIISGVRRGQCLLQQSNTPGERLIFMARLPSICLGILLGVFVFLWASKIFGTGGAYISLFIYCLSPNILAHTRLITPDISLTTFGFITSYFFWSYLKNASPGNIFFSGLFLGLTLLSKFPGLLWILIIFINTIISAYIISIQSSKIKENMLNVRLFLDVGIIISIACFIVLLGYHFKPFNYTSGIFYQQKIIGEAFPAFLNGEVSKDGGWWYYHIFAYIIKTPIPIILFVLASIVLVIWRNPLSRFDLLHLIVPIIIFLSAFSVIHRINIGLRYILPCLPFIIVFSASITTLWSRNKVIRVFIILLISWTAWENFSIYPHYLAYFNQFVGGPKNGHYYLVDSNLDWGQDLKGLKNYIDENGVDQIKLSYFGTVNPEQYGIKYDALPSFVALDQGEKICRELNRGDILAISVTNLYPIYVNLGELGNYLRKTNPIANIGYSILIYSLDENFYWNKGYFIR